MGRGKKQHFIYKIHFLCGYPTGRYYLGKHTGYIDDTYAGSGRFCFAYYKKYGKIEGETYIKEILEINPSKEINKDREKIIIGALWATDPLCMNQKPGGEGGATPGHCTSVITKEKIGSQHCKPILQYTHKGILINEWSSATEAGKSLAFSANDIGRCCLKHIDIYKGFIWRFKTDPLTIQEINILETPIIAKIDLNGDIVETYSSINHAASINNTTIKSIEDCCNKKRTKVKNFVYRFYNSIKDANNIVLPPIKGRKIKVNCYNRSGDFIKTYNDIWDAAKEFTTNINTGYKNIRACCRKKYNVVYNHIWRYAADNISKIENVQEPWDSMKKQVGQYDLNRNFIKIYKSASDAARDLGGLTRSSAITENCNGKRHQAYGFIWKYMEDDVNA